jgi:hypothetical protein
MEHLRRFVDDHFSPEGSEFEDWDPKDWNATIPLFDNIKVRLLKLFCPPFQQIKHCFTIQT